MTWDPDHYLRFRDHRYRPGLELIARIPLSDPRVIVDLGSGTGELTAVLRDRWLTASIVGVDSSTEMIERAARDHPSVSWHNTDISVWEPDGEVDLIFSNAALHWLDDHEALFTRLRSYLSPAGVLAVQMPDNWSQPTHLIPARILEDGAWPRKTVDALLRDRLSDPEEYRSWVRPATVDMWRTTYYQALGGEHPVWSWVTGSLLRPVLATLQGEEHRSFAETCRRAYADAYPPDADGVTVVAFSRFFFVAQAD